MGFIVSLLYLLKENKLSYNAEQVSVEKSREVMTVLIDGILNEKFLPLPDYNTSAGSAIIRVFVSQRVGRRLKP
jgi:hypothetical protein